MPKCTATKLITLCAHTAAFSLYFHELLYQTALQAGSSRVRFPMVRQELFIDNSSGSNMVLGSTQSLREMSKLGKFHPRTGHEDSEGE
jgi:hypothetical protein